MLNKILFVILIVLMGVLAFLSVRKYEDYKTQQRINDQQQQVQRAETEKAEMLNKEQAIVNQECTLKLESYNLLSDAEKKKVIAPQCGLELLQ